MFDQRSISSVGFFFLLIFIFKSFFVLFLFVYVSLLFFVGGGYFANVTCRRQANFLYVLSYVKLVLREGTFAFHFM